jgi:hypothetical protein
MPEAKQGFNAARRIGAGNEEERRGSWERMVVERNSRQYANESAKSSSILPT